MKRILPPRMRTLLALIAQGHSNKEIAYRTGLTVGTVHMYTSAIYDRLNVGNRTQATLWALANPDYMREPAGPDVYRFPLGV